jgi:hypothetical protein
MSDPGRRVRVRVGRARVERPVTDVEVGRARMVSEPDVRIGRARIIPEPDVQIGEARVTSVTPERGFRTTTSGPQAPEVFSKRGVTARRRRPNA